MAIEGLLHRGLYALDKALPNLGQVTKEKLSGDEAAHRGASGARRHVPERK